MKNIFLVMLIATLPISIFSQTTYYEINLNVGSHLMGEDVLKLGSDVKINTKEKTIEYTTTPDFVYPDGITFKFKYISEFTEGMMTTFNFKLDPSFSTMGKVTFNMLNNKMQFLPSCVGYEQTTQSGLYGIKMTSKVIE
jgi:hypothetical protein